MNPAARSLGVDGVLATQLSPVAASANVTSVNVPPTSMASVPAIQLTIANVRSTLAARPARQGR